MIFEPVPCNNRAIFFFRHPSVCLGNYAENSIYFRHADARGRNAVRDSI